MLKEDAYGNLYKGNYEQLFKVSRGVESIEIKASATSIYGEDGDKNAFKDNKGISEIKIAPNSKLKEIQNSAFFGCNNYTKIDLSGCSFLTKIDNRAFFLNSKLQTILFPLSLKSIGDFAFKWSGLKKVTIPSSVTSIGSTAFMSGTLSEITFNDDSQLTGLNGTVFTTTKITSIRIPPSITEISSNAFMECYSLSKIILVNSSVFTLKNEMLYQGNQLIMCPCALSFEKINVPEETTIISNFAFFGCQAKEVILNNKVETIGAQAFKRSLIERIDIPNSVTLIYWSVFTECHHLVNVTLSNQIKELQTTLFKDSALTLITIPDSVKTIGVGCFQNCRNLTEIVLPKYIEQIGGGVFSGCPNISISFSKDSPYSINSEGIMSTNASQILVQFVPKEENITLTVNKSFTTIKDSSFMGCKEIFEIKFEENSNITIIGKNSFDGCENLNYFDFSQNITEIHEYAFRKTNLTSIVFPPSLKILSTNAFSTCNSLKSIEFPVDTSIIERIEPNCFYDCFNLESIVFPNSLKSIGHNAFQSSRKLKSVVFPSSLEEIETHVFVSSGIENITFRGPTVKPLTFKFKAFDGNPKLKNLEFVDGLEVIESKAFRLTAIERIVLPDSVRILHDECFAECKNLVELTLAAPPSTSVRNSLSGNQVGASHLEQIGLSIIIGCDLLQEIICSCENFTIFDKALYNSNYSTIYAFPPASKTQFLYLPQEVEIILSYTFYQCANLKVVMVPDDSKFNTIGAHAFEYCTNLMCINIPITVNEVNYNSFKDCPNLICGLYIENQDREFRSNLVNLAKMPKRCLTSCLAKRSNEICGRTVRSNPAIFMVLLSVN